MLVHRNAYQNREREAFRPSQYPCLARVRATLAHEPRQQKSCGRRGLPQPLDLKMLDRTIHRDHLRRQLLGHEAGGKRSAPARHQPRPQISVVQYGQDRALQRG